MQNPRSRFVCYVGFLILMSSACPSLAQAPPPGGAALREVTQLERAAEPPGGLIPYRQGELWGYADTTGRLVIAPSFAFGDVQSSSFFQEGFATLWPDHPELVQWLSGQPASLVFNNTEYSVHIINARRELLRIRRGEAAMREPDGSLRCIPRWQAHGLYEFGVFYGYPEVHTDSR